MCPGTYGRWTSLRSATDKLRKSWILTCALGLQAAHVHLIFQLPGALSDYNTPLAFLHLYTPFRPPVNVVGLCKISKSTSAQRLRSDIVRITDFERSCHLVPVFGVSAPRQWTTENVLDATSHFYFNPYLSHRDFVDFRYGQYLLEKRMREAAEDLARKHARWL
jgi:hypothetical protein